MKIEFQLKDDVKMQLKLTNFSCFSTIFEQKVDENIENSIKDQK